MSLCVDYNQPVLRITYNSEAELKTHLQTIVDALNSFHGAQNDFISCFHEFRDNRLACNILQHQIADKLDKLHANCNVSSAVSSSVGIIGGIAAIGGLGILTLFSGGLTSPALVAAAPTIATVGGISGAVSGVTLFGTHISELVIEKNAMNRMKKILEKDQIQGRNIMKWFERSDEVLTAINNIMDYDVFETILSHFKINSTTYQQLISHGGGEVPDMLKILIDEIPTSEDQKRRLKAFLSDIFSNRDCFQLYQNIAALFCSIIPDLKIIRNNVQLAIKMFRVLDATFDVSNVIVNAMRFSRPTSKLLIAAGFLSAVSVAIDVYALFTTSQDIVKGSKSETANNIRNCAEMMNQELNFLEKIYFELTT